VGVGEGAGEGVGGGGEIVDPPSPPHAAARIRSGSDAYPATFILIRPSMQAFAPNAFTAPARRVVTARDLMQSHADGFLQATVVGIIAVPDPSPIASETLDCCGCG
jgi:hypothetical protein